MKLTEIKTEKFQLDKNLSKKEAFNIAVKKVKGDHRGFNYDPKTGIATFI